MKTLLFSVLVIPFTTGFLFSPASAQQTPTNSPPKANAAKGISIDGLFDGAKLWAMNDSALETEWRGKGFRWVSAQVKDHASLHSYGPIKLCAFGSQSVVDVSFSLKEGKLSEVSICAWNKGDSATLNEKEFNAIVEGWTAGLNKTVAPKFENRGRDNASAARAERRLWVGKDMLAQLEFSGGKERIRDPYSGRDRLGKDFQGEFIRVRLLPKPKSMLGVNASSGGAATVKRGDLAKSVTHDAASGDVFIPHIPMVDQGMKGYCAVATAARVLNYYGVPADQHEMAQVADSSAGGGTSTDAMEEALKKISGKYKTRFQILLDMDYSSRKYQRFIRKYNSAAKKLDKHELSENTFYQIGALDPAVLRAVNGEGAAFDRFFRTVRDNIDKGLPLMWGLQLGLFPENGEPARQSGGGHIRLIIGYNVEKKEIIFSDSWGAGHEKKRMAAPDAAAATMGIYLLQPAA